MEKEVKRDASEKSAKQVEEHKLELKRLKTQYDNEKKNMEEI